MPDIQINQILDIHERGLHYGDGLFETLLKLNTEIPLWSKHYNRLRKGCDKLSIPVPDDTWLLEKIDAETEGQDSAVVKIIVTRGRGGRGLKLPQNNQASVFILSYLYAEIVGKALQLDVAMSHTRLPINPNLAGIKHLNRLDYVLATIELERIGGMGEAILCDTEGYIVEGIISNLFFCLDDEVYTPSLDYAGVEGIMRQQILEHLEKQGIAVQTGRYFPAQLLQASECFLCNSVQGVRPIRSIDGVEFSCGPISQMLIQTFNTKIKIDSVAAD
jgi:4-amino-4-deoxychorismate lyase